MALMGDISSWNKTTRPSFPFQEVIFLPAVFFWNRVTKSNPVAYNMNANHILTRSIYTFKCQHEVAATMCQANAAPLPSHPFC